MMVRWCLLEDSGVLVTPSWPGDKRLKEEDGAWTSTT